MGREGGVALREKYGVDFLRRIAAEGGHATVSRYGTGYMAQIGSAGALRRAAKLARLGRTNEMTAYGVPHFAQKLDRHITGNWGEDSVPPEENEVDYEPFDVQYDRDLDSTDYEQIEVVGGYPPYPPEEDFDTPAEGDEVDDDPQCVCGVYRSEHSLCGCPEGFQTPSEWNEERKAIRSRVFAEESDYYDYYDGDDEPDYPERDCPDDDCTDYDAQDPYDMEYDVP